MNDSDPLFREGNLNPSKFGFVTLRRSAGNEPEPERLQEAARILRREPRFTDNEGFECEMIAAAISASNRVAYVESRAKDVGTHPSGAAGRKIDISIRIHLVEEDGTGGSVEIESYNPFFGCDRKRIAKHRSRLLKTGGVLGQIDSGLVGIPFKSDHATNSSDICPVRPS